eukprot:Nitzschia sp. Nitz4//scaffold447_size6557//2589//3731//NITZ4_009172-RA/size6557-processed-gene-0.5-mRNA-1//-1//CDS//3329552058//9168//frame0
MGGRNNEEPVLSKQTTAKIQQFENNTKPTGSLVLTPEDLEGIKVQSKIDQLRQKLEYQRMEHEEQIQLMKMLKENMKRQLQTMLQNALVDEVYERIVVTDYSEAGLTLARPGDGKREAQVLKAIHREKLQEKVRAQFQQQASDELMETYRLSPTWKERMGEREAKLLSFVCKIDALNAERKELQEKVLKTQKEMIAKLEKANMEHQQKQLEALRDGTLDDADDDDGLVTRKERKAGKDSKSISETKTSNVADTEELEEVDEHAEPGADPDDETKSRPKNDARTRPATGRPLSEGGTHPRRGVRPTTGPSSTSGSRSPVRPTTRPRVNGATRPTATRPAQVSGTNRRPLSPRGPVSGTTGARRPRPTTASNNSPTKDSATD